MGKNNILKKIWRKVKVDGHVNDVLNAYLVLAQSLKNSLVKGHAFNFSSGNPISVIDLVNTIIKISGKNIKPVILNTVKNALAQKQLRVQSEISEKKLAQSEKRYHRLFENVTDALVIFNPDSMQVEEINAAAGNLFGYTGKEMSALKVSDLSAEEEKSIRSVKKITTGNPRCSRK